jgi:alkyl-hydroperoxide reductase/thiol specific antioxidant family protein
VQLHRETAAIEARGGRLIMIGVGNRHFADGFRRELGLTVPLYVDTARNSYRALGMKRGVWATLLSPATWRNMVRAWRAGFRQKGIKGDPWQQGGVLVVWPGGRVAYRHLSQSSGDHPPVAEVLGALGPSS